MKTMKIRRIVVAMSLAACSLTQASLVYTVNNAGEIRSFTGVSDGATPMEGAGFSGGTIEATVAGYGSYQGFTQAPDETVYGVNSTGGVESWSSLSSWVAGDAATPLSTGVFGPLVNGASGVHGISYDGNTDGFYVTYEGNGMDGDIGEYANLNDFINNQNATVSAATYGGNILNFYYEDNDAVRGSGGNSHYFQVSGGGGLEGFQTLETYIAGPGNLQNYSSGFGGVVGGFAAIPEPSTMGLLGITSVGLLIVRRRFRT